MGIRGARLAPSQRGAHSPATARVIAARARARSRRYRPGFFEKMVACDKPVALTNFVHNRAVMNAQFALGKVDLGAWAVAPRRRRRRANQLWISREGVAHSLLLAPPVLRSGSVLVSREALVRHGVSFLSAASDPNVPSVASPERGARRARYPRSHLGSPSSRPPARVRRDAARLLPRGLVVRAPPGQRAEAGVVRHTRGALHAQLATSPCARWLGIRRTKENF